MVYCGSIVGKQFCIWTSNDIIKPASDTRFIFSLSISKDITACF